MFTAVWAQPPTVFERSVALRVRFERLSLPLGSNFLIIAPPECSFVLVLQTERETETERETFTAESFNRGRAKVSMSSINSALMPKTNGKEGQINHWFTSLLFIGASTKFNCLNCSLSCLSVVVIINVMVLSGDLWYFSQRETIFLRFIKHQCDLWTWISHF